MALCECPLHPGVRCKADLETACESRCIGCELLPQYEQIEIMRTKPLFSTLSPVALALSRFKPSAGVVCACVCVCVRVCVQINSIANIAGTPNRMAETIASA